MAQGSYADIAKMYAEKVVAGEILACKWVKAACQRQLSDLKKYKGKASPYRFNPKLTSKSGKTYMILAVNRAFSSVTGYSREEVVGCTVTSLIGSREMRRQYQMIRQELDSTGTWQGELIETRKSGELYPQWLQLNLVRDASGRPSQSR